MEILPCALTGLVIFDNIYMQMDLNVTFIVLAFARICMDVLIYHEDMHYVVKYAPFEKLCCTAFRVVEEDVNEMAQDLFPKKDGLLSVEEELKGLVAASDRFGLLNATILSKLRGF